MKTTLFLQTLYLLLTAFFVFAFALNQAYADQMQSQSFKVYIESSDFDEADYKKVYKDEIKSFYEQRQFEPVWFDNIGREKENIDKINKIFAEVAYENALNPNVYIIQEQQKAAFSSIHDTGPFEKELQATYTAMHLIHDLQSGRIDPKKFDSMIMTLPERKALAYHMNELLDVRRKENYLNNLAPQQEEYKQLKDKLADYRKIKEKGGWHTIDAPSDILVYPGQSHRSIPQIRKRLTQDYKKYDGELPDNIWVDKSNIRPEVMGDLTVNMEEHISEEDVRLAEENPAYQYDKDLVRAVAEFQYMHGKKADGVIGPNTISILTEPVDAQIEKIELAMERWRWLPNDLGRKHVRVNTAAFYARAVEDEQDQFVMPIIVGKVAHQTPVFSSVIKNVKIHPDWTSPDSIASRYLIPKIKNDPGVVHKLGYELQDKQTGQIVSWNNVDVQNIENISLAKYQFRQKPGLNNALGLARFSIENDYAIFMHGTPSTHLFKEVDRNFSSGCIRVQNPLVMAHFLLKDQNMSKAELEDLYYLDEGEFPDTTYIDLSENVPVHIMYNTAWMDQEGHIHFADDVYGRDERLTNALKKFD